MSFDITLGCECCGAPLPFDEGVEEGGTYVLGGAYTCELNVTYNYSPHYFRDLNEEQGLRWLDGKQASDTEGALRVAVKRLGVERSPDYWEATEGNAGAALDTLLRFAVTHPNGKWEVC